MPAFINNGPDIPEHLLQLHEEGRVVFFCGAGISAPAGLPLFKGLVDQIYLALNDDRQQHPIEMQAYNNKQYDTVLNQLEIRLPGKRFAVRTALFNILQPNLNKKYPTATHSALLQLSKDRGGKVKLVTTNFDRIFQQIIKHDKLQIQTFQAPHLPIPKPSRWDGIVHLHGLLPEEPNESELNRLILTSGDFGLAYLAERWASRFVSELFRNYTVCFVGYGIDDPVLRYMMDALGADTLLGESPTKAYAFASFSDGRRIEAKNAWQAKGVTPILYRGTKNHTALHQTLRKWADTYRDGVLGKEIIISKHATKLPLSSSRTDFAVGRVLWALTDPLAAKHFSELNPVPPLQWLEPLSEKQFGQDDLNRFGIVAKDLISDAKPYSILQRPAPYTLASWMGIVDSNDGVANRWDNIMISLAYWLTRHLNDPKLIFWLANQGGQLHENFTRIVRSRLKELDKLSSEGNNQILEDIRLAAPNAIPSHLMRTLWRLILSHRVKSNQNRFAFYNWLERFKLEGLSPSLRLELREILRPCVVLREPPQFVNEPAEQKIMRNLVNWDLVLASNYVNSALEKYWNAPEWHFALPYLLQDFTSLLSDALDIMRELGRATDRSDLSNIFQPSISEHEQNKYHEDWTILIKLTREAWLATVHINKAHARHAAEGWWQYPYPLFKRLAFFAATYGDVINLRQALDWLLADNHFWLWSSEVQREVLRLIVSVTPKLNGSDKAELEQAILKGSPHEPYEDNLDQEKLLESKNTQILLRLYKIEVAGVMLGNAANTTFNKLSTQYPDWHPASDESDEFSFWIRTGKERRNYVHTPRDFTDLVEFLKTNSSFNFFHENDWAQRCREDIQTAVDALLFLGHKSEWPIDPWRYALQEWSNKDFLQHSWLFIAKALIKAPSGLIRDVSNSLCWWLQAQSKNIEEQENLFYLLIHRVIDLHKHNKLQSGGDFESHALNHPIGLVTQAVLNRWYHQQPKDGCGLKLEIAIIFTELCDANIEIFRYARYLLALNAISLFRVDSKWAINNLIPLFDWQVSETEAETSWQGFLVSPRFYQPFISVIKKPLLETAKYYTMMDKNTSIYAEFLTYIALDRSDFFRNDELTSIIKNLPEEGLLGSIRELINALDGSGEHRHEYWKNRVKPFFLTFWPKSSEMITPKISETFSILCISTREDISEALQILKHWIILSEDLTFLFIKIEDAKLCTLYPMQILAVLDIIINDNWQKILPIELEQCLEKMKRQDFEISKDSRFIRLNQLYRKRNIY